MVNKDIGKDKLIKVAIEMLNKTDNPESITIRQIADRANVGVGLINYHFQSKDNLLYIALGESMSHLAENLKNIKESQVSDPVDKLKLMLTELSDLGSKHIKLITIAITYELQQGNFQTPLTLLPVLREIYKDQRDEFELRIIALEIISTIQVASINPQKFQIYSGIDINSKPQRDKFIERIIKTTIKK